MRWAQDLLGPAFRITKDRGKPIADTPYASFVFATVHPSAILRMPDDESRRQAKAEFVGDLKVVKRQLEKLGVRT